MENTTPKPADSDELESDSPEPGTGTPVATPSPGAPAPPPPMPGRADFKKLIFKNKYLFIFVVLVIATAGAMLYAIGSAKKSANPIVKTQSLTSKEIATLKGNTTFVGDSQQILSVQSSTIFEGQVLLRNNLEVAGTIKVSSPLSLSGLTVSGNSTLGQAAANILSVSGASTLQGDVSVQKNLTVAGASSFNGAVTAGEIDVTNLVLVNDLAIPKHITTRAGIPVKSCGPAIGDGSCSVSGSDVAGTVNINTGNATATGILASVTFTIAYAGNPHVNITPVGVNAGSLEYYVTNRTATGFSIATINAPPTNSNFAFDYIIVD
jgi:cytoskeletal protein CcmA (bactofilin family)